MNLRFRSWEENARLSDVLLANIKQHMPEITELLRKFEDREEDGIYRFLHQSFKVYGLQQPIREAVALFRRLAPEQVELNKWFAAIADEALGREFKGRQTNDDWLAETRLILEAFWHCMYFLRHMQQYGGVLDRSPERLPSGWASVLYLYDVR